MTYAPLSPAAKTFVPAFKRMLAPTSLRISKPNDAFEQEADRVAQEILTCEATTVSPFSRMAVEAPLQRKCACGGSPDECNKKASANYANPTTSVREALNSSGRSLGETEQAFFGGRFGLDFSNIRIHTDEKSADSANSVGARAYTVGDHIVFKAGEYSPNSNQGRKLLAHELTHTLQQRVADTAKCHDRHVPQVRPTGGVRLQRAPNDYSKLTVDQLRKLAVTDKGAADELHSRFSAMSNTELQRYSADPMAQSVLSQRTFVPKAASGQGNFSNAAVQDVLKKDIQEERAALQKSQSITRTAPNAVTPGSRTKGGTIGSARTDIPGLENRKFLGRSPQAGGAVNLQSQFKPPTDPATLPQTHGHAEQNIADQLAEALGGVPADQLKGRRVWVLIEQEPCSTCAQGIADPSVAAGVLSKLSKVFPDVTFEVKNLDTSALIILKNGLRATPASPASGTGAQGPKLPTPAATAEAETPGASGRSSQPATELPISQISSLPQEAASPSSVSTAEQVQTGGEGAAIRPASQAEILEQQRLSFKLETETLEAGRLSGRLHAYGAVFSGLMEIYTAFTAVTDALAMQSEGTLFGDAQRNADKIAARSNEDVSQVQLITDGISLLQAVASVSGARERGDQTALFDLSDTLGKTGMSLNEAAENMGAMAKNLGLRVQALEVLSRFYEKLIEVPIPGAGTIPQAQAFDMFMSIEKFIAPLRTAAQNYSLAINLLSTYGSFVSGLAHEANTSAWRLLLSHVAQSQGGTGAATTAGGRPPSAPPADAKTHATPPGVHLQGPATGFPSLKEQQGTPCPNCHQPAGGVQEHSAFEHSNVIPKSSGQISDADRQRLLEWLNAQKK